MTKRYQTRKRTHSQRGGVGYKLDVSKNCGGLPEVVGTSDCPDVGPGKPNFAQSLYGGCGGGGHIKRKQTKKRKCCCSKK